MPSCFLARTIVYYNRIFSCVDYFFIYRKGVFGLFTINPWALYPAEDMKDVLKVRYSIQNTETFPDGTLKSGNNQAMMTNNDAPTGGIDLANSNFIIKRDSKGMIIPFTQKDMAQLSNFGAVLPKLIEITPATTLPFLSELMQKSKPTEMLASTI